MTSATTAPRPDPAGPPEAARRVRSASGGADRVFGLSLRGAGLLTLLIMGGTGLFLYYRGSPALADAGRGSSGPIGGRSATRSAAR